jgi:peptidoglycan/xylan/chitin deacetylase (PgdA/CDA1 family)
VTQVTSPRTKPKIERHTLNTTTHSTNQPQVAFGEIYKVPRGYCALTFDDGPSAYTEKIARLLKKQHIPAAFFFIGVNVKQRPGAVRLANSQGFIIGDHTYSHPQLTKLSKSAQESQILKTKKQIETIIKKPVIYFRPPYEAFNNQTKAILMKNHMEMVLWNNDPRDWATKSPSVIVQRLSHSDLNGKVIILHDQRQTWEALPQIIKVIRAKGLKVKAI